MSNYHRKIMNMHMPKQDPWVPLPGDYKTGYSDARHAAAEIALEADARIATLTDQLAEYKPYYDAIREAHNGYTAKGKGDNPCKEPGTPADAICEMNAEWDKMLDRQIDKTLKAEAKIKELTDQLKAEQLPDGYPSWEDWLLHKDIEIRQHLMGWIIALPAGGYLPQKESETFPDYPTALAAAKKEAQR